MKQWEKLALFAMSSPSTSRAVTMSKSGFFALSNDIFKQTYEHKDAVIVGTLVELHHLEEGLDMLPNVPDVDRPSTAIWDGAPMAAKVIRGSQNERAALRTILLL